MFQRQHLSGQTVGGVTLRDSDLRLPQNRPTIKLGRHLVHGATMHTIARIQRALVRVKSSILWQ